ncbi:MAG: hypothetical protein US68_C0001G0032 [Candidatus Shapirobacteria bacterium GW2011_GWE1_38_10]|uniref:Outer membrane protein n=1 Tax=Candidatus Shapirobacteria bacterium GW2011_GWE1_38_10 TaxID=1618488 RepID=A0A0G0I685_9BACT|nr:MAG: hypothetical protein US46_C0004G0050 [Candidatus Shapirobacteria bacterium GW2011_GWF2_37_20]KKQ50833.1 MAG: hypothetical protein US68_C0001G0032 [Candidatus Shapirobacteria bacterium GW2011_GWE1_38_10]KKQ64868.1 MAG: hypothetical protein US85_C0002G0017 [Candidatus Shapirobacteria bacterium GW2011_GWF1_38_23]HBP51046.1 hypothetical protein [Candidatus Shapirobacteria bacterium]
MKKIIGIVVLVLILVWVVPWNKVNWGRVTWQPAEVVTVNGEAKSQEKNQIASYTAGVEAVNDKKEEAVNEVNTKIEALVGALKEFGIKDADIKTQNMSIYQDEQSYYDNGIQKSRKGQWRVNTSVEIKLREIDKASALADLVTKSGANNVWGPNFSMDDTNEIEKGLYDMAIKDAREKAESIAKASGRTLGKVLSVNDGGSTSGVYPMYAMKDGAGGGAITEPGSTTVYKNLTVVFELK